MTRTGRNHLAVEGDVGLWPPAIRLRLASAYRRAMSTAVGRCGGAAGPVCWRIEPLCVSPLRAVVPSAVVTYKWLYVGYKQCHNHTMKT